MAKKSDYSLFIIFLRFIKKRPIILGIQPHPYPPGERGCTVVEFSGNVTNFAKRKKPADC